MRKVEHLHIRVSEKTRQNIKDRAKHFGISQAKFVILATELVSDEDILQALLDDIAKKSAIIKA